MSWGTNVFTCWFYDSPVGLSLQAKGTAWILCGCNFPLSFQWPVVGAKDVKRAGRSRSAVFLPFVTPGCDPKMSTMGIGWSLLECSLSGPATGLRNPWSGHHLHEFLPPFPFDAPFTKVERQYLALRFLSITNFVYYFFWIEFNVSSSPGMLI